MSKLSNRRARRRKAVELVGTFTVPNPGAGVHTGIEHLALETRLIIQMLCAEPTLSLMEATDRVRAPLQSERNQQEGDQ